ncbi:MAG: hypothetical protein K5785_02290 [Nitrosarchaeum sp.]|nr:hypothetical protein [Nitrosarchaeum sp.]
MKFNMIFSNPRRGVSSIVGALLFTVLMIGAFSVLSLALDVQTDIVSTQRIVSDAEIKKQQERFGVAASTDANDLLSININNLGQNPVEISSIWITNKTLTDQPTKRFDILHNNAFIPSGFTSNILANQTLALIPDTYDIKVISSYGTIKTIELTTDSGYVTGGLRAEIVTDPPDVIIGQNVTVAMIVTNTGSSLIEDVQPDPLIFSATGFGSVLDFSSHTPASVDLDSGASVMFTWDYQVTGNSGDQLSFSAVARGNSVVLGPVSSNVVSDTSILRLPTDGGGQTEPDIVTDDLLARPQLFFIIPSSQGQSSDTEALWGINVVNPINAPMEVSKLVITAFAPGGNNNDVLFDRTGGNCNFDPISPTLGSDPDWSCPSENSLMWQDTANPIIIPANSSRAFLTKVEPGKPSGNTGLESILVQGSVFTTLGSFGKAGYQSTMSEIATSIANVFLTNSAGSRLGSDITTSQVGILPNTVHTFNVALADMDLSDVTRIDAGAKLIINVPKGWTDVTVTTHPGFLSPSVTEFGDTSTQIVGVTSSQLGSSVNPSDVITFTARSPNLTYDRLYVMYVLAQGVTSTGFSIGPLAEIILQVDA